jgi:lysophospholipase L1-like esterase
MSSTRISVVFAMMGLGVLSAFAEIHVKDGEKVAFLGDSITEQGNRKPGGYIHLVVDGLKAAGVTISTVPAGISGHKSNQMLARVDQDVLSKQPQWMLLSCGVNDVWHGARGVPLDEYKLNITAIVDKARDAGVKVMILTATMIREDQENAENQRLIAYNDFLRDLAKERELLLADLNSDMQAAVIEAKQTGLKITSDGVHMAFGGNKLMARGILRAFGVDEATLDTVCATWADRPETETVSVAFSQNEFVALATAAGEAKLSLQDYLRSKVLVQP